MTSIPFGREGSDIRDEQWIGRIREGGPEAFRPFVREFGPYIYRTVFAILRSPQDAEDVTQEVLLQVYRSLPDYRHQGLKTWIARIAVNRAIDWKRRQARRPVELIDPQSGLAEMAEAEESTERRLLEREQRQAVREGLERTPANYREVLRVFYLEGKSYDEIAAESGLERKSVKSRLYRARDWIRKHWRKEDFE